MANNMLKNPIQDLGLGDKVIQENRTRFLNKNGTFNVYRKGMFEHGSFSPYHAILNTSWPRFFWGVLGYYLLANLLFTLLYLASGKGAFPDLSQLGTFQRFGQLYYYSVQVISTLGSSPLHPANVPADLLLAVESLVGLFGFAIGASLLFARFSNPAVGIVFSYHAVIAPYQDIKGFMVRLINQRSNELVQVTAALTLSLDGANGKRTFHVLPLERDAVLVFPLNWTIVHPITPESPIFGMTARQLEEKNAEFLVSVTAVDQDLSKTVYARTSYKDGEIIEGKFANIIERDEQGTVMVDPRRVHEIE